MPGPVKPASGRYRLTDDNGSPAPYEVTVTADDKLQQPPLSDKSWDPGYMGFVIITEGGVYGFRCYGGTYTHFEVSGSPPVESVMDSGTCAAV